MAKQKKCKVCKEAFTPRWSTLETVCSPKCAYKNKKPTNKVSDSMRKKLSTYSKIKKSYMEVYPNCERCDKPATEIHHKAGRIGNLLTDINHFMSTCRDCHNYIHENPKENKKWLYSI